MGTFTMIDDDDCVVEENMEPEHIVDLDLAREAGPDRIVSCAEMREILSTQTAKAKNFRTGIAGLDFLVDGIDAGELIAIGGPPKHGKTLLAQTITANLAEANVPVLWFSFELPPRQFFDRMPEDIPFYVPLKLKKYDIEWTVKKIVEGKLKYDTRVVFIDNFHHLFDMAMVRNVSLDVGVIVRRLKSLAIDENLIIFILCHSRKPETKDGKKREVVMWDIRDSSFIPQESDSTWMVQRMITKKGIEISKVKVCCHRRTGVLEKSLRLVQVGKLFDEYHDESDSITSAANRSGMGSDAKKSNVANNDGDDLFHD